MSLFLPFLKKRGYLNSIHITLCIVGSRKVEEFVNLDYSNQGWEIFAPHLTIYGFDADEKACQVRNTELANRQINWQEEHIPLAVWDTVGTATLYVTKYPECSSLYPPNDVVVDRLTEYAERHQLMKTVEVQTTTLDEFFKDKNPEIDFLQIDVQGGELNVLKGAERLLKKTVLSLFLEMNFLELYKNQPLFSDVDSYVRSHGFTLFDIGSKWYGRRRWINLMSKQHPGQLVWTDAFYFRDLIRPDQNFAFKTPEQILKLACLADFLAFYDYALELLAYLTEKYGKNQIYNFTPLIIEVLEKTPEAIKQGIDNIPIIAKLKALEKLT